MVFEDNNEFNVELYNLEFNELFEAFKTIVKLIKYNKNKTKYLQGDFMGVKTKTFDDKPRFIDICIVNTNQEVTVDETTGYNEHGLYFDAVVRADVDIDNRDTIQFITETNYDKVFINENSIFKVELVSTANFKLKTGFKKLKLIKVE